MVTNKSFMSCFIFTFIFKKKLFNINSTKLQQQVADVTKMVRQTYEVKIYYSISETILILFVIGPLTSFL